MFLVTPGMHGCILSKMCYKSAVFQATFPALLVIGQLTRSRDQNKISEHALSTSTACSSRYKLTNPIKL